jgi:hypothetical protein
MAARIEAVFMAFLLSLLSGCGISAKSVHPDGTVVIDVTGPLTYRINGQLYYRSALWDAMENAHGVSGLKRFEFRIPTELLGQNESVSCGRYVDVVVASVISIPWRAYAWNPPDEGSKRELHCELVVLS